MYACKTTQTMTKTSVDVAHVHCPLASSCVQPTFSDLLILRAVLCITETAHTADGMTPGGAPARPELMYRHTRHCQLTRLRTLRPCHLQVWLDRAQRLRMTHNALLPHIGQGNPGAGSSIPRRILTATGTMTTDLALQLQHGSLASGVVNSFQAQMTIPHTLTPGYATQTGQLTL